MISFISLKSYYQHNESIKLNNEYMISISILKSILIEYYLQQSSIPSISNLYQISKLRRNIYSFIHIHQILLIDLDSTYSNEPGRLTISRFGISIQYSIIQYQTRKSNYKEIFETTINRCDRC